MAARFCFMLFLLEDAKKGDDLKKRREGRKIRKLNTISRDIDFIRTYRLSEELINILEDDLTLYLPAIKRSSGLPKRLKILCTLSYLGNACYQKPIGKNIETYISKSSVSRVIKEIVEALNHPNIIKKYIRFPQDANERAALKRKFYEKFQMPGVLGCIDGTLVAMVRPQHHEERYYCRKGYHARNVMIITDADLNVLHVDATFGGATHDSFVFANSIIKQHLEGLCESGETVHLLGDSGYAQREYLMTPFNNPNPGSPEEHYNKIHCSARNSVERALGVLKGRFRCLLVHKVLQYNPKMVAKIVVASCILHNICNRAGLPAPVLSQNEQDEETRILTMLQQRDGAQAQDTLASGRLRRNQLMTQLWRAHQ